MDHPQLFPDFEFTTSERRNFSSVIEDNLISVFSEETVKITKEQFQNAVNKRIITPFYRGFIDVSPVNCFQCCDCLKYFPIINIYHPDTCKILVCSQCMLFWEACPLCNHPTDFSTEDLLTKNIDPNCQPLVPYPLQYPKDTFEIAQCYGFDVEELKTFLAEDPDFVIYDLFFRDPRSKK